MATPLPSGWRLYKKRRLIAGFFGRTKHYRWIISRFENTACHFIGFLHYMATLILTRQVSEALTDHLSFADFLRSSGLLSFSKGKSLPVCSSLLLRKMLGECFDGFRVFRSPMRLRSTYRCAALRLHAAEVGSMSLSYLITGIVVVLVFLYLVAALLFPEKF